MIAQFDVFKIDAGGSAVWLGAFADLEAAKEQIQELLMSSPGEYFIFNQNTGHKSFVSIQNGTAVYWQAGMTEDLSSE